MDKCSFVICKYKLWKEIQLKFVGRHDKKAIFLRHFPDKLQEEDGATHDKEGPSLCGVNKSFPYKHNIFLALETQYCSSQCVVIHL